MLNRRLWRDETQTSDPPLFISLISRLMAIAGATYDVAAEIHPSEELVFSNTEFG
jgi:hypothetical protein